ncbi:APC family permease [Novosphingobium bradum]|uniref:APC family permease n=1 Tax=Novosphingobium bradum TaxID=1737444 RepID=A0ABV7IR01_9SPHN
MTFDEGSPAIRADGRGGLKKNTLGTLDIAFFIIAAASPLTGVIAIVPIMLGMGVGIGSPAAFLIVAGILLLFAVGYVAMTRHISNAGALYTYVTVGLGQSAGLGAAALTIFSYSAIQIGLYGGFGYYAAELVAGASGLHVPWWLLAAAAAMACLLLGVRGVHSGAVVLGISLSLECLLLLVLSVGMVRNGPASALHYSLAGFSPASLVHPGLGVGLMFACATFIGFEGSAIYSEEARDPKRTVPNATYFSVIFMAFVYSAVTWLIVNFLGEGQAVAIARADGGNLLFDVSTRALGPGPTQVFNVFIVSAIFAALLTFHNNIARYLYSLGRQGLLWKPLGATLAGAQTPHVACAVQTVTAMLAIAIFAVLGLDPYGVLFASMTGMGSVGIILAQTISAVAIFAFFRKSAVDKRLAQTFIAPLLAVIGLSGFLYYALDSVELLIGMSGAVSRLLAGLVFVIFGGGMGYGWCVKRRDPAKYARLARVLVE